MQAKTVAILESRLGRQLGELVAKHGGRPFHAPALAEIPDVDPAFISALISELKTRPADLMIFQTGVGTNALFKTTDALGLTETLLALLAQTTVVVRGPKPTAALRSRGVRLDISAKEPFTTTEVLEALQAVQLNGKRVTVQRYGISNIELEEALKARGAQVIEITTYRWSLPPDTRPLIDLMDALERRQVDAVTVTNAAQVYNLFEVAEKLGRTDALRAALHRTLVASLGPVSTGALQKVGVGVGLEASPPKLGPLMSALDAALSR
ncbi:MAG: uroporphyrinogen-III synthase [Betaproteobacteria bacterium]|nr:uroporphyrinogen-III synthase [Betaproteobacteria bacterium]